MMPETEFQETAKNALKGKGGRAVEVTVDFLNLRHCNVKEFVSSDVRLDHGSCLLDSDCCRFCGEQS